MATPPHRGSTGSHPSRIGSMDEGRNLEIITEGAELQMVGERPRSATLPGNMLFFVGTDKGADTTDGKEEEGKKEADKEEEDDEDKVFSQGKIGDHKFYSFTK